MTSTPSPFVVEFAPLIIRDKEDSVQQKIIDFVKLNARDLQESELYSRKEQAKVLDKSERSSRFQQFTDEKLLNLVDEYIARLNKSKCSEQQQHFYIFLKQKKVTYIKYEEGDFFKRHEDYLSLTTNFLEEWTGIMCIDASEDRKGGETVFYVGAKGGANDGRGRAAANAGKNSASSFSATASGVTASSSASQNESSDPQQAVASSALVSTATVTPKHAVFFRKDLEHEGKLLERGSKEIIMFDLWAVPAYSHTSSWQGRQEQLLEKMNYGYGKIPPNIRNAPTFLPELVAIGINCSSFTLTDLLNPDATIQQKNSSPAPHFFLTSLTNAVTISRFLAEGISQYLALASTVPSTSDRNLAATVSPISDGKILQKNSLLTCIVDVEKTSCGLLFLELVATSSGPAKKHENMNGSQADDMKLQDVGDEDSERNKLEGPLCDSSSKTKQTPLTFASLSVLERVFNRCYISHDDYVANEQLLVRGFGIAQHSLLVEIVVPEGTLPQEQNPTNTTSTSSPQLLPKKTHLSNTNSNTTTNINIPATHTSTFWFNSPTQYQQNIFNKHSLSLDFFSIHSDDIIACETPEKTKFLSEIVRKYELPFVSFHVVLAEGFFECYGDTSDPGVWLTTMTPVYAAFTDCFHVMYKGGMLGVRGSVRYEDAAYDEIAVEKFLHRDEKDDIDHAMLDKENQAVINKPSSSRRNTGRRSGSFLRQNLVNEYPPIGAASPNRISNQCQCV